MYNIGLDININEWNEIVEKKNYKEVIKGLQEKGVLSEEMKKNIKIIGIEF
jgi:hypothetical protein